MGGRNLQRVRNMLKDLVERNSILGFGLKKKKTAILLFEGLCALGNYYLASEKTFALFMISWSQVQLCNRSCDWSTVNSWDLEISNSIGKTGEYCLALHLSTPHQVSHQTPSQAGLISYSQKGTTWKNFFCRHFESWTSLLWVVDESSVFDCPWLYG